MNRFRSRRLVSSLVLAASLALLLVAARTLEGSLRHTAVYSGALLLALLVVLTLFNARKKLPFLPLLKASTWMQIHIYLGLFCVALFLVHIEFRLPDGVFEILLAAVFVIVTASGIFGLFVTRTLPPRITASGESIVYERIPALRHQIQTEAEELVVRSEGELQSSSLTDFYVDDVRPYLRHKTGVALAFGGGCRRQQRVEERMKSIRRYLAEPELPVLDKLRELVDTKRNLDYQWSAQRLLKLWLFVHIPFTYSLLLFSVAHAIFALTYIGRLN